MTKASFFNLFSSFIFTSSTTTEILSQTSKFEYTQDQNISAIYNAQKMLIFTV